MKKIPMRMCVVTREKLPKYELARIVKSDDSIIVDDTGKLNGHGCYIKLDELVIMEAKKKKILDRVLETQVPDEVYDTLISKIKR
ncbi:MAG: YlxR family protein [Bacilli bacterium]|nr:YlxR family protein [Bacilli bacterium]